ncbi:MAG TPA: TIGR03618 family F420-dependent PPOX class oxidoreductase [Actinomycetota bacterium]
MTDLAPEVVALLRDRSFAHLALVDDMGRPHVTPVWVDATDDGRVLINTAAGRVKERALTEGAPVALSIGMPDRPYSYVLIRGTVVSRTTGGADEVINRLSQKYHGTDFPLAEGMVRVTILIAPEHVVVH